MPYESYTDREARRLAESEADYERVKERLTAEDQARVDEQKRRRDAGERHQYGHDLLAAIARAEFNKAQDDAMRFLLVNCDGNIFAALGRITRAYFDADETPQSGETQVEHLRRALQNEIDDLERKHQRAQDRRAKLRS